MDALNFTNKEYYAIEKSRGTEFKTRSIPSNGYRFLLVLFIVAFFAISANATVYYVSNSGNDANTGTSVSSPWKTLDKVSSFSFSPGDQVLFKRGDNWSGTLKPRTSGASGNPVVYGAYGTGEKPKIYGSEVITGWTLHSGNIYKATYSGAVSQVMVDGEKMRAARYPNNGSFFPTTINSQTVFSSTSLDGGINYTGANITTRAYRYRYYGSTVASSSGQQLTLDKAISGNISTQKGFILTNKLEFLDQAGEWYSDGSTVYLWVPDGDDPDNYKVRVTIDNYCIHVDSKNYITFTNLDIRESNYAGIYQHNSTYITIDNCDISYHNTYGVRGESGTQHNTVVSNSTFYRTGSNAVSLYIDKTTVYNCNIESIGLVEDIGVKSPTVCNAISVKGNESIFKYNTIKNIAGNGIGFSGTNCIIEYNYLDHTSIELDDGGAIYTYQLNAGDPGSGGSVIRYNIVTNTLGNNTNMYKADYPIAMGIYLDNNTHDVLVEHNTVAHGSNAISIGNYNINNIVRYNTLFDNALTSWAASGNEGSYDASFTNNIIYITDRLTSFVWWTNKKGKYITTRNMTLTANNNKVYNPYQSTNLSYYEGASSSWDDWTKWQAAGYDVNSTYSETVLLSGEKEQLYYNSTSTAKSVDLGGYVHKDLNGNNVSSFTLQPFTSVILIKTAESSSTIDETKPVISSLNVPSSSSFLTVPVNSIVASDNVGVTGYLLTETSTIPNLANENWSSSIPTSYTFSSEGNKTLYAWVKDAAGNISESKSASILISTSVLSTMDAGYTELYSSKTYDDNQRAVPVTFNEEAILTSISIYHEAGSGSFVMGVYADQDSKPSIRLGMTPVTVVNAKAGWQTVELSSPVLVSPGQTIWLSWLFENNPGIRWTSGTPGRASSSNVWSSGMPETFGNANIAGYIYSIYCTTSVPGSSEKNEPLPAIYTNEEITICKGDSYEGWTTSGSYERTLTAVSGADSIVTTNLIVNPVYEITEEVSRIEGEDYLGWTETGIYERTLTSVTGCDSIVTTHLFVALHKNTTEEIAICEGDSYEGWTTSGTYQRTLTAMSGADSIVTTNLIVNPVYQVSEEISILEGENYLGWTESGVYERTLTSVTGCDSIIITELSIALHKSTTEEIIICEGDSYEGWNTSGTYQRTLTAVSGADSIVTTTLIVNPVYEVYEDITIFEGGNYLGWTNTGQYERMLTTSTGCDSIIVTNLFVETNLYTTEDISICEGESYNGWTKSGQYQQVLMASSGADSIVVTNLTVTPSYNITEIITILKGEEYFGWTESGNYNRNLTTNTGCDSIVNTTLIVMEHFKPVWWNENGRNHMNFYIADARINDVALDANDEIGIFDGIRCVGVAKLAGPINENDENTRLFVKTSQDDGSGNGFISGNQVVFKIWDSNTRTEFVANNISYENGLAEWVISGKFVEGGTSVVKIGHSTINETKTQTIELERGWNIFSSNVVPESLGMDAVQDNLRSMGYLIKVQDEIGNTFERVNGKDGWINNIGNIQRTEGYQIRVKTNCTLEITGQPVKLPLNIVLREGSNLVSFPYNSPVDAIKVIQPLIDNGILEKVQDEKGNSIEYWGNTIGWVNSIGNFNPGEGYIVQVNKNGDLTIFDVYEKSAGLLVTDEDTDYFNVDFEGNGSNHMNININNLKELNLVAGDEIAAYDGEVCVGAVKLNDSHINNNIASIRASASDFDITNGFTDGNSIELKLWHSGANKTELAYIQVTDGTLKYQRYGSVFVKLMEQGVTNAENFLSLTIEMYPNPTTDRVNIRFSEIPETGSTITLTDISGREIIKKEVGSTNVVLDVESQPAGMYFVKILVDDKMRIEKLIKN